MQPLRFQTPGVFLKRYFQNNPEQLKSYVKVGLVAAKVVVAPLSAVLKHLIEIQGMDPNIEPGRRMREEFDNALNGAFWQLHNHEYDTDFNFSWLSKKFEEARKSNGQFPFDLSQDEYRDMTDVSNFTSPPPPFTAPATRTTTEAGIPVTIDQSPVDELADLLGVSPVNQIAPEPAEQARDIFDEKAFADFHAFTHDTSKLELPNRRLKDALEKLVMFAKEIEEDSAVDPKELFAKTDFLKNMKKDIEQYGKPVRPIKKAGKVHRAKARDVKTIKKTLNKKTDHKVEIVNATNLANEMAVRGLCSGTPEAISEQVNEILKFPKEAFNSLQNVVMRHPIKDMEALKNLDARVDQSEKSFKSDRGSFRRARR